MMEANPQSETAATAAETGPPAGPTGGSTRLVLGAVVLAAVAALFWPRSEKVLERRPGGFLVDGDGRPVSLLGELAPVTLVHLWGTWCPPCRTELPELVRYARELPGDRVRVLFVAVGDDPDAARRFLAADDQPLLFDPAWEVSRRLGTRQLPETHVVVGEKVVHSFIGPARWADPAVRAEVQKWTATPASAAP